jgi:hypothetical protein
VNVPKLCAPENNATRNKVQDEIWIIMMMITITTTTTTQKIRLQKAKILQTVLYGCKTMFFLSEKENRLQVF